LQAKSVTLRILNMHLDTNDATGKLMLQIIGSIAEFETNIMLSRSWKASPRQKRKANIAAASPQLAPRPNRFSLWLTRARPEQKRQKR
jgi:DNA invertase Pin-like site-specific DNA recombinase